MRKPERGAALIDHLAGYCSAPIKTECHHSDIMETREVVQSSWNLTFGNLADVFINAKINLAAAERDLVLASYAILQAMGRISVERLGRQMARYEPSSYPISSLRSR